MKGGVNCTRGGASLCMQPDQCRQTVKLPRSNFQRLLPTVRRLSIRNKEYSSRSVQQNTVNGESVPQPPGHTFESVDITNSVKPAAHLLCSTNPSTKSFRVWLTGKQYTCVYKLCHVACTWRVLQSASRRRQGTGWGWSIACAGWAPGHTHRLWRTEIQNWQF